MTLKTRIPAAAPQLYPQLNSLRLFLLFLLPIVALVQSCSGSPSSTANSTESKRASSGKISAVTLTSRAFQPNMDIPSDYTCDGADQSPDLEWAGLPTGTKSVAVICEDPDAPGGTFTHWVVFDIPASEAGLSKSSPKTATMPNSARQGKNDFGAVGYGGPCPPRGSRHRYFFRIYALDTMLDHPSGSSRSEIESAIKSHAVGEGSLACSYSRH
ncbi:MAG: YbhB/YbcL family Raf kinase inhibitor-like protein [Blastocatellia bacterium]